MIIFVHGCFWHGHEHCKYFVVPKTKTEWWLNKISHNMKNDKKAEKELKRLGWKLIIVWECDLKRNRAQQTLKKILKKLSN